ncbi:hypothetical protein [Poseidonibacter sp.]|uniref:hypothetical protein n=1 Tax=Poseidonibacter sp. TaxID=2321188 RepID=UPI003C70BACC
MNLEEIQEKLINDFDFERAIDILEKLNETYTKEDLIQNAKNAIKMVYVSRENEDIIFQAGYLVASRSYYEGSEVSFSLSFTLEIHSSLTFDLEVPFNKQIINEKEEILKNDLRQLLALNKEEYEKDEDNDLLTMNIYKIEKMLDLLE